MARKQTPAPAPKQEPASAASAPVDEPAPAAPPAEPGQPVDEQPAEPETTTDYTRRAGGYVLTERGWVLEK